MARTPIRQNHLNKIVNVNIDVNSWAAQPANFRHRFPRELPRIPGRHRINILEMLFNIGFLTSPQLNNMSLFASWWPVVRYIHVFSSVPDLRLLDAWEGVDPHQKSILSDDCGMGLTFTYLNSLFSYKRAVDGRAFARRLAQLGLIQYQNGVAPRIGYMKTPDFAFLDSNRKIHLLECKGTQGTMGDLKRAMGTNSGTSQKRSIQFVVNGDENRFIAQRLVAGILLTRERQITDTTILISDPSPSKPPITINERVNSSNFKEAIYRGDFTRILANSGFPVTATRLGQFDIPENEVGPTGEIQRDRLSQSIEQDSVDQVRWSTPEGNWVGREIDIPLFSPIEIGDRHLGRVIIRNGVSQGVLNELRRNDRQQVLFQDHYPNLITRGTGFTSSFDDQSARIVRTNTFINSVEII